MATTRWGDAHPWATAGRLWAGTTEVTSGDFGYLSGESILGMSRFGRKAGRLVTTASQGLASGRLVVLSKRMGKPFEGND